MVYSRFLSIPLALRYSLKMMFPCVPHLSVAGHVVKKPLFIYLTINEQIQKSHKEALQERIEASKGKVEPKPQVKKK